MRALRVLGLADTGERLVCEDETTGERFAVPTDDVLRHAGGTAARSVDRVIPGTPSAVWTPPADADPAEVAPEPLAAAEPAAPPRASAAPPSRLRPAEIQSRIRAGSSTEEVAAEAGTVPARIERFAYPVLLERSSMADRARRGVPLIDGAAGKRSVDDVVTTTLAGRGHAADVRWDAFRSATGWVLVARWAIGRSEHRAEWAIHPRPGIGTLTPRNDAAVEIVDPSPRPLRTIGVDGGAHAPSAAPTSAEQVLFNDPLVATPSPLDTTDNTTPPHAAQPDGSTADASAADSSAAASPVADAHGLEGAAPAARTGTDHATGRNRRSGRPVMPSWDDVLLGGTSSPQR